MSIETGARVRVRSDDKRNRTLNGFEGVVVPSVKAGYVSVYMDYRVPWDDGPWEFLADELEVV